MEKKELTEAEWELIEAIRNFKKSKNNISFELEMYIKEIFERLLTED